MLLLHCLLEQLDYTFMDTVANCQVFIYLLVCLIFQFLFLQIPSQISVPRPNRGFGIMLQRRLWVDCAWYIELMDSQRGLIILSIMLRFIFIYVLQKGHV